jgi:hypothetical protein
LNDMLNEEKPLPYYFDVLHHESISEQRLVEHIDRAGIVIYAKDTGAHLVGLLKNITPRNY